MHCVDKCRKAVLLFVLPLTCVWGGRIDCCSGQESVEHAYLSNIRQVTGDFVKAGEGYFSPDGKSIVFQAVPHDYPFYQIYTLELGGAVSDRAKPKLISTGRGRTTCSYFSPDGERLLFASSHVDPDLNSTEAAARREQQEDRRSGRRRRYKWVFDEHMELFVADRTGEIQQRLTHSPGYDAECSFSADGRQIVFCSTRDGDPDLYVMDADGNNVRQITNEDSYDGGPFFSPDGQWITFRADRHEKDRLQIYVIRSDGTQETSVTEDPHHVHWAPYWHPTEPYLIWCGADHATGGRPNYDLWLMRYSIENGKFKTGTRWRITDHASADVLPVFSPDGKHLMWTSSRSDDASSQLYNAEFRLPEERE